MRELTQKLRLPSTIGVVIGTAIMVGIHYNTLYRLSIWEWDRVVFQYCYLIPVVIGMLIWTRRSELASMPAKQSWFGLVPVMIGCFFLLLGELGGEYFSLYISIWFMIVGLCWTQFGWHRLKTILFPLALLLTTFPPPRFFYVRLTTTAEQIAAKIAAGTLAFFNIPVFRHGNVLELRFVNLQLYEPFSGLRFLIPTIIAVLVLLYLFRVNWLKSGILLFFTGLLTVLINGVRVAFLAFMANNNPDTGATGWVNEALGWLMLSVISGFLLVAILLSRGSPKDEPERQRPARPVKKNDGVAESIKPGPMRNVSLQYALALAMLIAVFVFLQYRYHTTDQFPQAKSLETFPATIGHWQGKRSFFSTQLIEELDLTDYVRFEYSDRTGKVIDFYVAWYNSQSKGESIHTPETCFRGTGWQFKEKKKFSLALPGYRNTPVRLTRSVILGGNSKQFMYYWFRCRGRSLINAYELKFFNFWDRLTRRRTDGAIIWAMTPISDEESRNDAEKRIQDFLKSALPILDTYLPD